MKFKFSGLGSKKNSAPVGFIPTRAAYENSDEIGWLGSEFEPWEHNPDAWSSRELLVPELKNAPPIRPMDMVIKRLMESTWKIAEPVNSARGALTIGNRGGFLPAFPANKYHPQVSPTVVSNNLTTLGNDDPIASDWKIFQDIERKNAVTFRGDSRSPHEVIVKCGGFYPPSTRTDRDYLQNQIHSGFNDYLNRRYGRGIERDEFLRVVDNTLRTDEEKKIFIDYMMWRQLTQREAGHLGRMVNNEKLKGYVSTTPRYSTAKEFALKRTGKGWIYVTKVHGGFVVPPGADTLWGSGEMEIAQYGPIPAARIVGFVRLGKVELGGLKWDRAIGPIYFRPSFRAEEPEAFNYLFNELSANVMGR